MWHGVRNWVSGSPVRHLLPLCEHPARPHVHVQVEASAEVVHHALILQQQGHPVDRGHVVHTDHLHRRGARDGMVSVYSLSQNDFVISSKCVNHQYVSPLIVSVATFSFLAWSFVIKIFFFVSQ